MWGFFFGKGCSILGFCWWVLNWFCGFHGEVYEGLLGLFLVLWVVFWFFEIRVWGGGFQFFV